MAQLLRERHGDAQVSSSSNGFFQWIPASSLEAQQGGITKEEAEQEIRAEFEDVLGKDLVSVFEKDFTSIRSELEPTFRAMPKNEYGELGHTAVRYMLHRLFVARHGWYIQGLDPEGNHFNSTSPAEVLKGQVPTHVQQLIEKMLYGRGFGLSEVALMGAMLENLIHQEAIKKLATVFAMFELDTNSKLKAGKVDETISHYLAGYILGEDVRKLNKKRMLAMEQGISTAYPNWGDTKTWARDLRHEMYGNKDLSFNEIVAVVVGIGEKHGRWQNRECTDLKAKLMQLEDQKDGCVPIANFYKSLASGKWQFGESPDYLVELGALDDSDPKDKRVMIPNYLDGASNCVASSSYYSVCCINECEEILGRIEKQVQAPDAPAEELVTLVASLPSPTATSGRTLPAMLIQRLHKIADSHGGRVPIHSRLFMQWMHNAYPHECPYPHVSGRTSPRMPEAWMADTHKAAMVSESEAKRFVAQSELLPMPHGHGQCGKWLEEEELYVPWSKHPSEEERERDEHIWFGATSVGLMAAVASMTLMLIRAFQSFQTAASSGKTTSLLS